MDKDIREMIIKMVTKKRLILSGRKSSLTTEACPFEQKCNFCGHIFPEWGDRFVKGNMNGEVSMTHPCWTYGEDYVLAEMRRLFPELY